MRYAFWAVVLVCGLIIALRLFMGPFSFLVRVDSPLNIEAVLGLTLILVFMARSNGRQEPNQNNRSVTGNRIWLHALLLLLLSTAAYWHALGCYFLSDDFNLLTAANSTAHNGYRNLFAVQREYGFYRPISNLSLALTATWAGYDSTAWHASNLILHFANTLLVYILASNPCSSPLAALFAAALFSIHGTRPEAAVWIAGRFDLLATFFVLSGLILFTRAVATTPARGRNCRLLSLLCMVLAILSKESAYTFPLLAALCLLLERGSLRNRIKALAPCFLLASAVFAIRWMMFGGIGGYRDVYSGQPRALTLNIIPALKVLLFRLWAVLCFPINWTLQPGWWIAVLMMGYVIALGCLAWRRTDRRKAIFSLGFVLVSALPPLHLLLIGSDLEKSRFLYLPSVGFCILLALAAEKLGGRKLWLVPCLVIAFNLSALDHNLKAWEYASTRARMACAAAVDCTKPSTGKLVVSGIPAILHGVYFFGNGFEQCVAMQRDGPPVPVELRQADAVDEGSKGVRFMRWDGSSEKLRCVDMR
ncbi:MAG TPA: hypothetical protein VE398_17525 [Acidobacteriota bacterium]|nr:hypothetical protein [Acidobacteriota bacterium]